MATRKYWDRLRAKVVDVLETLSYHGADVLTPTHTSGRGLQVKNVADPTDPQDAVTKAYYDSTPPAGGVKSVNGELPDGSGDVALGVDSVAQENNESGVSIKVPIVAYGVSWVGSKQAATEGAVHEEMEKKVNVVPDHSLIPDSELAKLQGLAGRVSITLPAETTVAGRVLNAVEGVDYPTGWVLSAGANPVDLKIVHNLDSNFCDLTVLSIDPSTGAERLLPPFSQAFTGIQALDRNILCVEGLTEVMTRIRININMI
jgi:hypothetical protein